MYSPSQSLDSSMHFADIFALYIPHNAHIWGYEPTHLNRSASERINGTQPHTHTHTYIETVRVLQAQKWDPAGMYSEREREPSLRLIYIFASTAISVAAAPWQDLIWCGTSPSLYEYVYYTHIYITNKVGESMILYIVRELQVYPDPDALSTHVQIANYIV